MAVVTPGLAKAAILFEKYVLSVFFLYFAYGQWNEIGAYSPEAVKHSLIFGFFLCVGVNLLASRPSRIPPLWPREVLVPLVGTFLYLAYGLAPYLPAWAVQGPSTPLAIFVAIAGYALSGWAAVYLGRSMGVFVAFRKVVSSGPYRYMRHPMYVGHAIQLLAILMADFAPFYVAMTLIYLTLLLWRARMEERVIYGRVLTGEPYLGRFLR